MVFVCCSLTFPVLPAMIICCISIELSMPRSSRRRLLLASGRTTTTVRRRCAKWSAVVSGARFIQEFVWLCVHSNPPSALKLWEQFKTGISVDFTRAPYNLSAEQAEDHALSEIERQLLDCGHTLARHGLPVAKQHLPAAPAHTADQHAEIAKELGETLNDEQRTFARDFLKAFGMWRDLSKRLLLFGWTCRYW